MQLARQLRGIDTPTIAENARRMVALQARELRAMGESPLPSRYAPVTPCRMNSRFRGRQRIGDPLPCRLTALPPYGDALSRGYSGLTHRRCSCGL